ncbi:MAG: DNA polymerase III subunit alpha [Dehalococcoidales bacterium]
MAYAELHCHSYYSFHDGASSLEELALTAKELGYTALALTDHDNLCGAMCFSRLAADLGIKAITGAEITLKGGHHLTLLVKNAAGYRNLCRLITLAHADGKRRNPELDPAHLPEHAGGLIALSGCPKGELAGLATAGNTEAGRTLIRQYLEWFGKDNYFIELQHNLVFGDRARNKMLALLAAETGASLVAAGNVHYHTRARHRLQDCLVAIAHNSSLEETHRERRANSEFYLRPVPELNTLFKDYPEAIANTSEIASRCTFDLSRELAYTFPSYPAPAGFTAEKYLERLCLEAAVRRYGSITPAVKKRLDEELELIRKYNLAGFLLLYHEVIKLGREAMVEQGLANPDEPIEENPPGRGRGSSVALLAGYLIGLSHIDPLKYNLGLERFLPQDTMTNVPDIDLDFPRSIRESLILKTHRKWGYRHAALTGTIVTYKIRGAVRDLGKALDLPPAEIDRLCKHADYGSAKNLAREMQKSPHFRDKIEAPLWRELVELAGELDAFPRYMGQHPGGMIISSTPLTDMVPVCPAATDGRYVCQWDKDSIDDAGFVKIDFLALGALSQLQAAGEMIKERIGRRVDLSRIDFDDTDVYDMLCRGDTIGIFQVESAAQMQTVTRLKPRNLLDMAHEVGAVRPGVGVNGGVRDYLARRSGRSPVSYDNPLEKRALERTLGVVLFQDQLNQLAIDVAGMSPSRADLLRRAFGRKHNTELIARYREEFISGALSKGADRPTAEKIFNKFNGLYMFPESHAFAFGVTAYQAAWMKYHYPLEFFAAIFQEQPMGFYNLETLKEDAKRHGIKILNPDINASSSRCKIENGAIRLGLLNVRGLGDASAASIEEARKKGVFQSIAGFLQRTGVLEEVALGLAGAGAFDNLETNRRKVRWQIGLLYRPLNSQLPLPLPVSQDMVELEGPDFWERMQEEYSTLDLFPAGHIMASLRPRLDKNLITSREIAGMKHGSPVNAAGLVIRRQRPLGKVIYITLEDEFGHIPLMVFPKVYAENELKFRSPFLEIRGTLSRREGTCNIIVHQVNAFSALKKAPASKDWG